MNAEDQVIQEFLFFDYVKNDAIKYVTQLEEGERVVGFEYRKNEDDQYVCDPKFILSKPQ